MRVVESCNYEFKYEEDLLDNVDVDDDIRRDSKRLRMDPDLRPVIYVQLRFCQKLQRRRVGRPLRDNNGITTTTTTDLPPLTLSSFKESIVVDAYYGHLFNLYLIPLRGFLDDKLLPVGVTPRQVYLIVRLLESHAIQFANLPSPKDVVEHILPIAIDVELVTTEIYGPYEKLPTHATQSSIDALEKVKITTRFDDYDVDVDHPHHREVCAICLEKLCSFSVHDADADADNKQVQQQQEVVAITRMPCSHLYHNDCILHWLSQSYSCPICRFELPYE